MSNSKYIYFDQGYGHFFQIKKIPHPRAIGRMPMQKNRVHLKP